MSHRYLKPNVSKAKLLVSKPHLPLTFPGGSDSKESACNAGDQVQSLGWKDPLEEEMATHSSILAWKIPGTEEPGGQQSMGSQNSQTRQSR